jgi:hypothetical protein
VIDLLIIWLGLSVVLIILGIGRTGEGGALTLAYFAGLSLIHVPGALIFLGHGADFLDRDMTELGFQITVIGMGTFVVGTVAARWRSRQRFGRSSAGRPSLALGFSKIGWKSLAVGVVSYFVLIPLASLIPSLTSIVAAIATVLILGLWLMVYEALLKNDELRMIGILALLPLLPLATLAIAGFLGFGVYWILSVLCFLFVTVRDRTWFYVLAGPLLFFGMSLFVTYMGQRTTIREAVWLDRASIIDRLEGISNLVTDFQLFSLDAPDQATSINDRLNQNMFVADAIVRYESGINELALGSTVPWWALIPRAIWPDKPDVGGSGDVVAEYTGLNLSKGTSFGIGQVLEFYINFGIIGVIVGFFAFGYILKYLDIGIMRALKDGDMRGLLLRAMPGLAMLQPGGSLLEVVVAVVAAMVAARIMLWLEMFSLPTGARGPETTIA